MNAIQTYERLVSLSRRVYRILLAAYPKEFRREYGADMVQLFRDQCRDELRSGGVMAWMALWFWTLMEMVGSSRRERDRARARKVHARRKPGEAVLHNFWIYPGAGLGQIYNYQTGKGLALLILYLVIFPLLVNVFSGNSTTILLVAGVIWVWSTWDSYRVAKRTNAYLPPDRLSGRDA